MKKIIKYVLLILCMGTIFFFSNDERGASTKKSDGVIINITEKIMGKSLKSKEKEY